MGVGLTFSFLVLLPSIFLDTNTQVDAFHPPTSSSNANRHVYIVFTSERPPNGLRLLSSVLGSEKAAKDALIYSYDTLSGFAAKLTDEQARCLEEQPGIVSVHREKKYSLDDYVNY